MSGPERCGHERSAHGWVAIESCPKSGFTRPPYLHPEDKKSTNEPERCAAYDRHENPSNECCGCHYECGEYPEAGVHTDPTNRKYHAFVPPKERL